MLDMLALWCSVQQLIMSACSIGTLLITLLLSITALLVAHVAMVSFHFTKLKHPGRKLMAATGDDRQQQGLWLLYGYRYRGLQENFCSLARHKACECHSMQDSEDTAYS